jgi:hypothetical protein
MRKGRFVMGSTGLAAALMLGMQTVPATAGTNNLVANHGAEASAGGTGGVVPAIPGWTRQTGANSTVVKYGTPGFPKATSPGPTTRGKNFFAGGPADELSNEVLVQTVPMPATEIAAIDAGHGKYHAQAFLGGKGAQKDMAFIELDFKDGNGFLIGNSVLVGPVTATDRNNVTGLLRRFQDGSVPVGARSAFIQLIFEHIGSDAYNDSYADNIQLQINH